MTDSRRQPEFATHKECVHFSDGFCTLNGVAVDQDGAACPNFAPRDVTMPQAAKAYQQPRQIPQVSVPFGQRFLVPPSYPENYPVTQRSYGIRRQGGAGVHSVSSGRGGGGGRGGNSGGRGRGRGRMGGFAAGPGGSCVCPRCGYTAPHRLGSPCFQQICPRCGTPMTRKRSDGST